MSPARIVLGVYLAAGLVRSVYKTRHLRSLVEQPQGGAARLVAVYLLCAVLWLPLDGLAWLDGRLAEAEKP